MIRIYTDGACSCNPGPGGWAAILLMKTGSQEICGGEVYTTNNRMELSAVVEALDLLTQFDNKHLKSKKVSIYSDSAYVVNAINKDWITKWRLNQWNTVKGKVKNCDLWIRYVEAMQKLLQSNYRIHFHKVKGHDGDYYNEKMDKLAKAQVKKIKV